MMVELSLQFQNFKNQQITYCIVYLHYYIGDTVYGYVDGNFSLLLPLLLNHLLQFREWCKAKVFCD